MNKIRISLYLVVSTPLSCRAVAVCRTSKTMRRSDNLNPLLLTHTRVSPPSKLGGILDGADLEAGAVLREHALAVVLPELLGGVLAGHALEDLGAAGVVVEEACRVASVSQCSRLTLRRCVSGVG